MIHLDTIWIKFSCQSHGSKRLRSQAGKIYTMKTFSTMRARCNVIPEFKTLNFWGFSFCRDLYTKLDSFDMWCLKDSENSLHKACNQCKHLGISQNVSRGWLHCTAAERRSFAGELSLFCARTRSILAHRTQKSTHQNTQLTRHLSLCFKSWLYP